MTLMDRDAVICVIAVINLRNDSTPHVLLRGAKQNEEPRLEPGAGCRPAERGSVWVPRALPVGLHRES